MGKRSPASGLGRNPIDPFDGPVASTIDLHGMTALEARTRLGAVLARLAKERPGSLVHVITGKGRNSSGPPVLRQTVRTLLKAGFPGVADWCIDDSEGGYLVRLR